MTGAGSFEEVDCSLQPAGGEPRYLVCRAIKGLYDPRLTIKDDSR